MQKITELSMRLEAAQTDSSQKLWAQYTTGFDFGLDQAQEKVREIYRDKKSFEVIQNTLEKALSPLDRRRAEIMLRDFRPYHFSDRANELKVQIDSLQNKLASVLNLHRPVVDGREMTGPEILRILSESADRELRKKAYLSRTQINRKLVANGFLDLIHLRQEYAAACEAKNFVALTLEQDDLSLDLFQGWREQGRELAPLYKKIQTKLAQKFLGVNEHQPWDTAYLKNQVCNRNRAQVELTGYRDVLQKAFQPYGFDIESLAVTYDIFPRKNKSEWGYMFPISIGRDARILANMDNRFSSFWVLLHETAHAVHFLGLDPEDAMLNRGVSGIVAEGLANFFGDLSFTEKFLELFFNEDLKNAVVEFSNLKALASFTNASSVAITLFDQALYLNDLKTLDDIHQLKWSFDKDLLDAEPGGEEPIWGHIIHHTTAPVYFHNYFLGDVLTEGMKTQFERTNGTSWDQEPQKFGAMWSEQVLKPSGEFKFMELFEQVCGTKPNVSEYLKSLIRGAEALV